jgi:hypothetical protein
VDDALSDMDDCSDEEGDQTGSRRDRNVGVGREPEEDPSGADGLESHEKRQPGAGNRPRRSCS